MKKIIGTAAIGFALFLLLPMNAKAQGKNDPHYRHEYMYKAGETPSGWCEKNPQVCGQVSRDTMVSTKYEKCLDELGNRDGYIEGWEIANFGNQCKGR